MFDKYTTLAKLVMALLPIWTDAWAKTKVVFKEQMGFELSGRLLVASVAGVVTALAHHRRPEPTETTKED